MTEELSYDQVQQAIKTAFADIPCPYEELANLDHDDLRSLAAELAMFPLESFHYVLPQVLINLLDHRTAPSEVTWVDAVIGELDPLYVFPRGRARLIEAKKQKFSQFTRNQAKSILGWLNIVRTWPELEGMIDEINETIEFWQGAALE